MIETAAAPALDRGAMQDEAQARPRLAAVHSNPQPQRTSQVAIQPPLFQYRQEGNVVGLHQYTGAKPAARVATPDTSRQSPRRRTNASQTAFEFDAPAGPSRPLSREITRRTDYPVAPLQLRAMAALFDLGMVVGFTAVFLVTVRLFLGVLPLSQPFLLSYAAGAIMIAFVYKLLWCMFGQVTLGLQGARLGVVSFDGMRPTVSQRFLRMFSGWLSFASAGMGVLWAVTDLERLSWHDHISQTFLTHRLPEEE